MLIVDSCILQSPERLDGFNTETDIPKSPLQGGRLKRGVLWLKVPLLPPSPLESPEELGKPTRDMKDALLSMAGERVQLLC